MNTMTKPILFPLGRVVITPGAEAALYPPKAFYMLGRHARGDWGCVCDEDKLTNDEALQLGNRVLSAYPIDDAKPCKGFGDNCIWIITECDRSVTTLLLPEEY